MSSRYPLCRVTPAWLLLRNSLTKSSAAFSTSRAFSSDHDGKAKGGFLHQLWEGVQGKEATEATTKADVVPKGDDENGNALVPSGPERRQRKVLVVELARKPLFPGVYTPVLVTKADKFVKEIMELKKQGAQAYVGAFLKRSDAASSDEPLAPGQDPADRMHEVGTFAQVHTIVPGDTTDSAQLLLLGHRRIKRTLTIQSDPLKVHIQHLKDETYHNDEILKATSMEIVNTMRDLLHLNPLYGEQFRTLLSLTGSIDLQDTSRLLDAAASLTSADETTLQGLLEQLSVPERAKAVLMLLKKEVELCKLQADIREQVESKILKEQRRMLLMEQLKSIKKELGLEKDDKSALIQRFQTKWEPHKPRTPPEVAQVIQDELDKLSGLEPVSPEFNVTRNYLDWLTSIAWGSYSEEVFDIDRARKVLDTDHYGLDDVKERILEFIAVSRLRGSTQGKILCLVGPPGVGKTSVGRSIANTLNRKYFRFSVGGLYDVAEIKGHRRTYIGAMPGKMVQCLKNTQTCNPLVLIDEIDKLGRGHSGDPASALLELLDPEQNTGFLDHYLDVPLDLSKVLFVCTANVLDTIPGPLLDRMEVIRLSGYAADEKKAIARQYLEPQASKDSGVPQGACAIPDPSMDVLINEYAREAGVRNLKKHLETVYRKVALKLVKEKGLAANPTTPSTTTTSSTSTDNSTSSSSTATSSSSPTSDTDAASSSSSSTSSSPSTSEPSSSPEAQTKDATPPSPPAYEGEPIVVNPESLKDYLGAPPFTPDKFYETTPPGVVMGMAWTAMGGATLYVEAVKVVDNEAKGTMTTTGQLGDVFRESISIAHTFARGYLQAKFPENHFFSKSALHVHVPAGSTPKDGPSAGCTVITALLSLALDKNVRPDLAMTGEVTLTGRVLPIGGVKEKILAARRSGVKHVLFPQGNKRDYDELSDDLKAGLTPYFVKTYDEVFKLALDWEEEGGKAESQ